MLVDDSAPTRARPPFAALVALILVALAYTGELFGIFTGNRAWFAERLPDDAFYYLQVARNIADGHGPTFDGIHLTNGFHPLWELFLVPFALLTGGGDALVRSSLIVGLLLSAVAMLVVGGLIARAFGLTAAVVAVLVAVHSPGALASHSSGMETALALATLALVLWTLARALRVRTTSSFLVLGACSGLLVLSRLDFAEVVWIVGAVLVLRTRSFHAGGLWLATAALVVAPPLLANLVVFRHLLTVSGSIKLDQVSAYALAAYGGRLTPGYLRFVSGQALEYWLGLLGGVLAGVANIGGVLLAQIFAVAGTVLAIVGLGALVRTSDRMRRSRRSRSPEQTALLVGVAMVAAKATIDIFALPFWAQGWYEVPQRAAFGLLAGLAAWRLAVILQRRSLPAARAYACIVGLLLLPLNLSTALGASAATTDGTRWQGANLQASDWIRTRGPAGRYGSPDSGILGYYSDRAHPVVNLDGLVNDYQYAAAIKRGDTALARYRQEGVRYLVARREPSSTDAPACAIVIWTSPQPVAYTSIPDGVVSHLPVRVWDLGGC